MANVRARSILVGEMVVGAYTEQLSSLLLPMPAVRHRKARDRVATPSFSPRIIPTTALPSHSPNPLDEALRPVLSRLATSGAPAKSSGSARVKAP